MSENRKQDLTSNLLLSIHENIARADEKLKALVESTNKEFKDIRDMMREAVMIEKKLEDRVAQLELEGTKISAFWKILMIAIPISITILFQILVFLLGR